MGDYINVVISEDNRSYHIEISTSKSDPKAANYSLETLQKIEFILKNDLSCDNSVSCGFSTKTKDEMVEVLKEKSAKIISRYNIRHEAYLKDRHLVVRFVLNFFSKKNKVDDIGKRIVEFANMTQSAKILGYEDSPGKSVDRLNTLFEEIELAYRGLYRGIPPKNCLVFKDNGSVIKELDHQQTAEKLKSLTLGNTIEILLNPDLYSSRLFSDRSGGDFSELRNLLNSQIGEMNVTMTFNDEDKPHANHALNRAAKLNNINICKAMIKMGADINAKDSLGRTPLHSAIIAGNEDVVKFLIENGADVNTVDKQKYPSFILATNSLKMMKILLESTKVSENIISMAFRCIVRRDDPKTRKTDLEMIKILHEEYGAKINQFDSKGQTPLHRAVYLDNDELAKYLIEKGANIKAENSARRIPICFANRNNAKMMALLQPQESISLNK